MTQTYWLPKEIEVKTNITILKKGEYYYASIEAEGYGIKEVECFIDRFGQADADVCETDDQWNAVTETFQNYIIANGVTYARKCDKCGKGMNEGYCIQGGEEYYCTPECLHQVYTIEEWQELHNEEEIETSLSYWTEWDSSDYQFVLFDNQLIEIN
jgi:hypothetical protein